MRESFIHTYIYIVSQHGFASLSAGLSLCLCLQFFSPSAMAQTDSIDAPADTLTRRDVRKEKMKHTGSLLKRFFKNFDEYDTDYITPNYYNFTAMMQNTNFVQQYRIAAKDATGKEQSISLAPTPSFKVGPYVGWRWIFVGYTFDLGHPKNATKSTELSLSLYSSMLGADFVYIRNTGTFKLQRVHGFDGIDHKEYKGTSFEGMQTHTFSLNAYYVLNHKHFSYPAAYAQSTVQRKSCGSWILGFSFDKQKALFDYKLLPQGLISNNGVPVLSENMKVHKVEYSNFSISGGYAYNWVFARNFLFNISGTPAIGYKKLHGEKIGTHEKVNTLDNVSFNFLGRSGIVWNNTHWYAGASWVGQLFTYRKNDYMMTNFINHINIYVGFNFNRKRQYKNAK